MKAIIVDLDGKYLIVVNRKGDFKRVYNNYEGRQIGDEIDIPDRQLLPLGQLLAFSPVKRVVAAAVLLLFFALGGYGVSDYMKPVTFVTVDINPSVELSLNRYERVLSVKALNGDGEIIADNAESFKNMRLEDALKLLLDRAISGNYLNSEKNTVMLAVSNVKNTVSPDLEKRLKEIAETELKKLRDDSSSMGALSVEEEKNLTNKSSEEQIKEQKAGVEVIVENTTIQKHDEARKMNISQGKLLLYEKLKKIKPGVTLSDIKKAPVSQILGELKGTLPVNKTGEELKSTRQDTGRDENKKDEQNKGNDKKDLKKETTPDSAKGLKKGPAKQDRSGLSEIDKGSEDKTEDVNKNSKQGGKEESDDDKSKPPGNVENEDKKSKESDESGKIYENKSHEEIEGESDTAKRDGMDDSKRQNQGNGRGLKFH